MGRWKKLAQAVIKRRMIWALIKRTLITTPSPFFSSPSASPSPRSNALRRERRGDGRMRTLPSRLKSWVGLEKRFFELSLSRPQAFPFYFLPFLGRILEAPPQRELTEGIKEEENPFSLPSSLGREGRTCSFPKQINIVLNGKEKGIL